MPAPAWAAAGELLWLRASARTQTTVLEAISASCLGSWSVALSTKATPTILTTWPPDLPADLRPQRLRLIVGGRSDPSGVLQELRDELKGQRDAPPPVSGNLQDQARVERVSGQFLSRLVLSHRATFVVRGTFILDPWASVMARPFS